MSNDARKRFGILKLTGIAVIILLIAIIAIPFLLDANQFRPQLESKLTEVLGRDVKVGNLQLSLLSGSLAVNNISIADNPEFSHSPFVTAKSLTAAVELKPLLFSKEVRVTGISLDGPTINLIRYGTGKWNFSDIGSKESPEKAGAVAGASSLPETDILVKELEITGGRITSLEGRRQPVVYENVTLTARNLSFTTSFPFEMNASLPGGGRLKLEGEAGPLNKMDMLTTPMKASLVVTDFDLVASGFVPPSSGIKGVFDFNGSMTSNGKQARSKGSAKAESLQLVKGGAPADKPVLLEYSLTYSLDRKSGNISETRVQSGKAIASLTGSFEARAETPDVKMRLRGSDMPVQDLESLLPAFGVILPAGASLQGGSMDVDLTAEGSLDHLITEGQAAIVKTRLAGFDLAGKMSALTSLSGIQSNQLTEIEKFITKMKLTPTGVQVNGMQMIMPALGELSGTGRIAADQSLDFVMRAQLKPSGGIASELTRLTKGNAINLPFFVRGTASHPKFIPDTKNAASSILESVISDQGDKPGSSGSVGDTLRSLFKKK